MRIATAIVLAAGVGCADRAGEVASRCGNDNDAELATTPGLTVAVEVGPWGRAPGVGFCVRAARADGTAFEALTDHRGIAIVPIDPERGPWDVTAARVGYQAVSILDVDGPIEGALYTEAPTEWPEQWPGDEHELFVTIRDVDDRTPWFVFDDGVPLTLVSTESGYAQVEWFDFKDDAPPFRLTALVGQVGVTTLDVARENRDVDVIMPAPTGPLPATLSTRGVRHPNCGKQPGSTQEVARARS